MHTKYKNLFLLLLLTLFVFSCDKENVNSSQAEGKDKILEVREGDFYVAKDGDDKNPGTKEKPFLTIQKGVNVLSAGETLIVREGVYHEFVFVEKGGQNNKKINILSEKINDAECGGFRIFKQADNVKINGFKITETSTDKGSGIVVYGRSDIEISDCSIFECPTGGIRFLKNAKRPIVVRNTLTHNGFFGIYMDADNATIEGNTISRTVQFHPHCNPSEHPGADADGIIIYGGGHKIINNEIIDIGDPNDAGNKTPHSDCIQSTKIQTNTVLCNSVIANNYFRVNHHSGKGIILESKNTYCENVMIYNNVFEIKDIGISAASGKFRNLQICNNVFKTNLEQKSWGTAVFLKNVENYEFSNNITIDCRREHRKIVGGTGVIANNLAYNSDNSAFSMTPPKQASEIVGGNPMFVKYTGNHGENDYHIAQNSPARDKGKNIDFVKTDKNGILRPQGKNYDIGAYEFTER